MEDEASPVQETLDLDIASSIFNEEQELGIGSDSASCKSEEQDSEFEWADSELDDFDPLETTHQSGSAPQEKQPLPAYISGLEVYFDLPIGKLPPIDVCQSEGRNDLAQVPVRDIGQSPVQYHFFANDTAVIPSAPEGIYNELVCQFENCNYRCPSSHGIRPLFKHITETHEASGEAVTAFRQAQRDYLYA